MDDVHDLPSASGGSTCELLNQYGTLNGRVLLDDPKSAILEIDRRVLAKQQSLSAMETANFGVPLGGSPIPGSTKTSGVARKSGKAAQKPTDPGSGSGFWNTAGFACGSVPCVATVRH
jgi:aspartate-semialdehyde dehydrogenase